MKSPHSQLYMQLTSFLGHYFFQSHEKTCFNDCPPLWLIMALDRLAPEVLTLILRSVDSFQDLHSLISASAPCYRVFCQSPELVLSSLLKRFIPSGLLGEAVAATQLPPPNHKRPTSAARRAFLREYFSGDGFELSKSKSDLASVCRLHRDISKLIHEYSKHALDLLGGVATNDAQGLPLLSGSEYHRFYRAFLRYETYCRVFPYKWKTHSGAGRYPARCQYDQFLAHFQVWEVEEIRCAFTFIAVSADQAVDELEETIKSEILATPGAQIGEPGVKRPGDSENEADMVHCDAFELMDLELFSTNTQDESPTAVFYLASLGIGFACQLAMVDFEERKLLVRQNITYTRDFLCDAVKLMRFACDISEQPDQVMDSTLSQPNLGWYLFDHRFAVWATCERAYIFWSTKRIQCEKFKELLTASRHRDMYKSGPLSRGTRDSLQKRLSHVWLPEGALRSISNNFGSIEPPDGSDYESESSVTDEQ